MCGHSATAFGTRRRTARAFLLSGVDKFEPVSAVSEMDHAEKVVGRLVMSRGNSPVDLEMTEQAFDLVTLLVELPLMLDLYASV